jgi:hypothetical protein
VMTRLAGMWQAPYRRDRQRRGRDGGGGTEGRRAGRAVTLIERGTIGGTCVNVGCVCRPRS